MNWITNLIDKKTNQQSEKKEVPGGLWVTCNSCSKLLFKKDLVKNLRVCTNCGYHFYLPVLERLDMLFNNSKYSMLTLPEGLNDPLKFKSKDKYSSKLKQNQEKTGFNDSIVSAYGKVGNSNAIICVMNFDFMGGSMGTAFGEGFVYSVLEAIKRKVPFIAVSSSGGARMQEGTLSLMQMPKTTVALEMLKDAKLPYITILVNPTTGGVTASFAMLGDIHIAEQGATIAFTGARVIEQTLKTKLPEGFQTAEYLQEHGMVDIVTHRQKMALQLSTLLDLLTNR